MLAWIVAGLVAGIILAEIFVSWYVGIVCVGTALVLALFRVRRLSVFLFFVSLGIIITIPRLSMLPSTTSLYGQRVDFVVESEKIVYMGEDITWQGIIQQPQHFAGAGIQITSADFTPGCYTLSGTLYPPVRYRNPGQQWHYKRRIYGGDVGVIYQPQITGFTPVELSWPQRVRSQFQHNLHSNLGADQAAMAQAITTGDRSMLDGDLRSSLYVAGLGHILALSGLHVSTLSGLIMLALKRFVSRGTASIIVVLFLIIYVIVVGPAPSLIRAVLMSAYGVVGLLLGRQKSSLPALLWTCFFMLAYNPLYLFDYAFIFSFLATLACILGGSRLKNMLSFLPQSVRGIASVTIIIQLVVMPLSLILFGNVSLWGPLSNIVILPLLPFIIGLSFALGLGTGWLAQVLAWPATALLRGVATFIELLGQYSFQLELTRLMLLIAVLVSVSLLCYFAGQGKHMRRMATMLVIISLVLVPVYFTYQQQVCTVWFLDVGQGDATLVRMQRQWFLVDCGEENAAIHGIVPALKHLGVRHLSALVITHPHSDHAGGMDAILENFSVDQVLVDGSFTDSTLAGHPVRVVRDEVQLAPGLKVLGHGQNFNNVNDNSLLVSLTWQGVGVLLTGDIEEAAEQLYLNRLSQHQVLSVPHHGSRSSTSMELLATVQPETTVISCGLANRYGFPHTELVARLTEHQAEQYRTDQLGFVGVRIWPWNYQVFSFIGRE